MKRIAWIALGWLVLITGNAQGTDDAMPPEVKALIGMELPPIVVGKAAASVPNFISREGGILKIDAKTGGMFAFDEGVVGDKWPVFIIERISKEQYLEVLDIQVLPDNLIDWHFIDGKFQYLKKRYRLSEHCRSDVADGRIIFGLVKPEKGKETCDHDTDRVKQTWQIDVQTGRISAISTQGLQCHYLLEDPC